MTRTQIRHNVHDEAGAVIQNALCYVYEAGTTTPVGSMYLAATGGSPVTTLTSDEQGDIIGWIDTQVVATLDNVVDVKVTDNSNTAYFPSVGTVLDWPEFTETVPIPTTGAFSDSLTAIGDNALAANTTGIDNTAFGARALEDNTSGDYNTAVGYGALRTNTSGIKNTGIGYAALENTSTGTNNTAIGHIALNQNTTGQNNTGLGDKALSFNYAGSDNTSVGKESLRSTGDDDLNVALGVLALYSCRGGSYNTALGSQALSGALDVVASGSNGVDTSTFAGAGTLNVGSTAGFLSSGNLFVYVQSHIVEISYTGKTATSFTGCTSLGSGVGSVEGSGSDGTLVTGASVIQYAADANTAVGFNALNTTTTGHHNVGVGSTALALNETGSSNVAVGSSALTTATSASQNTAVGASALAVATTGGDNTGIGYGALRSATTASDNTAVGVEAGYTSTSGNATTTGTRQTLIGKQAGQSSSTQRDDVVAIGYRALVDGNDAIAIGSGASAGAANSIAIGKGVTTSTANEIKLGLSTQRLNVPGRIMWSTAALSQTTVGAAGAASALPATPEEYLQVLNKDGNVRVIPAYLP